MSKRISNWPAALVHIVLFIVLGWVICSIASCTATQAKAHAEIMTSPGEHVE